MKKKGQLTIFIILAIVLVFGIIIFYISTNQGSQNLSEDFLNNKNLNQQQQITRDNIYNCIDTVTKNAITRIAIQGGHYEKPEKSYDLQVSFFSYYYHLGEFLNPSEEEIETALSDYINDNLPICINKKDFPLDVEFSEIKTTTNIEEKEVYFIFDTSITITNNESTAIINLENEEFNQPSYIQGAIEIASYLTEYNNIDPVYYCINCLGELAAKNELNVDIFPFLENDTYEVVIHENRTNSPNLFMFVYLDKYTGEEKSPIFDDE
jgi:hypothetical protein